MPIADKLWEAKFDKDVEWMQLSDAGYLVVNTSQGLFGVKPEDGSIVWKMDDVKKVPEDFFSTIPGTQFVTITKSAGPLGVTTTTLVVDVTTGKTQWTTKDLDLVNSFGMINMMEAGAVYLFGQHKDGKMVTMFVDLATGKPLWTNETLYKKKPITMYKMRPESQWSTRMSIVGNQPPVFLDDGSYIEFMSQVGPRRVNGKTGEVIWTSKVEFEGIPGLRDGYAPFVLSSDKKVLFIPHGKRVDAISVEDGSALWKKAPKLRSKVTQMQASSEGLVVRGSSGPDSKPYIDVIDFTSGETRWKKPFKDLAGASSFDIQGDKLYIYADESIFEIVLATGENKEIVKTIRLSGNEIPSSLAIVEQGYLLTSSQNMLLYDKSGNQVYHAYHKAPGSSLLAKVASTAAIMAVNAASAASAYSQAQSTGMSQSYTVVTSNPVMSKRFKATAGGSSSVTVLTDVKTSSAKGPGLVKVDRKTGADVKCVVLGTKEPKYEFDDVDGMLFFLSDDKVIQGFKF
ncbi:MAG: PQQ-like beta-propeller repeat protein [bacterium]|nr:PQQ-like beta-propeller repeat protein [bacterium]